jgi:hypothetical protein
MQLPASLPSGVERAEEGCVNESAGVPVLSKAVARRRQGYGYVMGSTWNAYAPDVHRVAAGSALHFAG